MTRIKVLLSITVILCLIAVFTLSTVMTASVKQVECEESILIAAPPGDVWARLTDINNWSHWFQNVTEAKVSGQLRPGTSFDWKAGGVSIHSTLSSVKFKEEFAWTGQAYTLHAVHNWKLRKTPNGGTQVVVYESMSGLVAVLFRKTLLISLRKDLDESLLSLKQACEQKQ